MANTLEAAVVVATSLTLLLRVFEASFPSHKDLLSQVQKELLHSRPQLSGRALYRLKDCGEYMRQLETHTEACLDVVTLVKDAIKVCKLGGDAHDGGAKIEG